MAAAIEALVFARHLLQRRVPRTLLVRSTKLADHSRLLSRRQLWIERSIRQSSTATSETKPRHDVTTNDAPHLSQEEEQAFREYREKLENRTDRYIRSSEARREFLLSREDLKDLPYFTKESPYGGGRQFKQYELQDVVKLALEKHSEATLQRHFWLRVLPALKNRQSRLGPTGAYGYFKGHEEEEGDHDEAKASRLTQKTYWYNAPSTTTEEGVQSVLQGLKTNIGICSVKGGVWYMTGSHVVFADLMHSFADVANYSYRLLVIRQSGQGGDAAHPYGYAPLRYITADRSFVFLFFVGGVFPVMTGVKELMEVVPVCDLILAPAAVFLASAVLEGQAVKAAYSEISVQAVREKMEPMFPGVVPEGLGRTLAYLKDGRDVMSAATFTEASSGVLGAGVGLGGLWLSWYMQSGAPDVFCSIVMGGIVCLVSSSLLRRSGNALLGQTLPSWRVRSLILTIENHPAVVESLDVKTEMVGTDTVRFKAEVQFNPQTITERLLQAAMLSSTREEIMNSTSLSGAEVDSQDTIEVREPLPVYTMLAKKLYDTVPELADLVRKSDNVTQAELLAIITPALCKNNIVFYEALAWELKDIERQLRAELSDFKNVHIDLEPW